MPGLNQKGPMGDGSMTGRRMGRCTNSGANQQNAEAAINATNEETTENKTEAQPPVELSGRGKGFGRGMRPQIGRGMGSERGIGGMGQGLGRQNRFRGGV